MMGPARAKTIVCVLVVIVAVNRAAGQYENRDQDGVEGPRVERMHPETSDTCVGSSCLNQNEGPVGAMWFGPRLGRRRRSDNKLTGKKMDALGEVLASPNWGLVSLPVEGERSTSNDEKRQETTFTPRLGRELEDALQGYDILQNLLRYIDEQGNQQQAPPPMFPPRLGRNLLNPRNEHELRVLLRKLMMQ